MWAKILGSQLLNSSSIKQTDYWIVGLGFIFIMIGGKWGENFLIALFGAT